MALEAKRKEIIAGMADRKLLEDKAYHIVTGLIEGVTTEQHLSDVAQHLTPTHYSDIVEERSIEKLCGYPLCENEIKNVRKQKYTISRNAIYDLTKRKLFCSDTCFTASEHFEPQVSSVPLWMRKKDERIAFTFLTPDKIKARPGDLVSPPRSSELAEEVRQLSRLDIMERIEAQAKVLGNDSRVPATRTVKVPTVVTTQLSIMDRLKSILAEWVTGSTVEFLHVTQVSEKASRSDTRNTASKMETEIDLPPVDNQSPVIVRKRIVYDKLSLVLPGILKHTQVIVKDILPDLCLLIGTFSLSSKNILLKPKEWTIMGVIILNLVACRSQALHRELREESFDVHVRYIVDGASAMEISDLVCHVLNLKTEVTIKSPTTSDEDVITSPTTSDEGAITSPTTSDEGVITYPMTSDEGVITSPTTSDEGVITSPTTSDKGVITSPTTSDEGVITSPMTSDEGA